MMHTILRFINFILATICFSLSAVFD